MEARMAEAKRRVAVLGATGMVGQRLVRLLEGHPWFELAAVAASEGSRGRSFAESVKWRLPGGMPAAAGRLEVLPPEPGAVGCDLVFSALESRAAEGIEAAFRSAGATVVSNAAAHRMDRDVPLVIPEINAGHLPLVELQRGRHGGAVVANPNCSSIGLCLALEPLRLAFGLLEIQVVTLQALSGAGHPGVASLDALGNVVPFIGGEEEKLETEPAKIFGELAADGIAPASLRLDARCTRVPVRDGHLLCVSVRTERAAGAKEATRAWEEYRSPLEPVGLPSAPARPVLLKGERDRPQPALDRDAGGGMAVTVGGVKERPGGGVSFVALVHNTVRGAAGGTLLIAELLEASGSFR
jgi:aspartate-semialdehyde dehydrogenase